MPFSKKAIVASSMRKNEGLAQKQVLSRANIPVPATAAAASVLFPRRSAQAAAAEPPNSINFMIVGMLSC